VAIQQAAIFDACILIDFAREGRLDSLSRLPFLLLLPDLVHVEITRPEQKRMLDELIENRVFSVISATASEIDQISDLNREERGLSPADCSVVVLAQSHLAVVLSNDTRVRRRCERLKIECHGTAWLNAQLAPKD
jgi:predicted nucleic acid-binding protein